MSPSAPMDIMNSIRWCRRSINWSSFKNPVKRLIVLIIVAGVAATATGRLSGKDWTFEEMFDKADLIVIGKPISTEGTRERTVLTDISPPARVVGLSTAFEVRLVLKGDRKLKRFVLHHYKLEHEEPMSNGPALVMFDPNQSGAFLLFLVKEPDGRYAPVTGQTDPGYYCIIELKTEAE
jgi:hypothetical protein